jgi:long-chain acyl-CoA synthetase
VGPTVKHANDTLSKVGQVKRFRVLAGPWLPDSDVLTALSKLKRRNIAARYSDEIDQMSADTPRKPVQVVAAG